MADNLHQEVLFKTCFCSPTMRLRNYLMINKLFCLVKKKALWRILHRLYSSINSSKKIHFFGKRTELLGIIGFTRTRLKKPAKFSFYIKTVAHCDLSPKRDKSCYLFWCISIVISLNKFLRFLKSKYAKFFHYFSKQCSS